MTERQKLEQIAGGSCSDIRCQECPIRKECDHIVYDLRITGPAFALTEEFRAAARAKLAEMDKAQEVRIDAALSAPDESAMEKVRQIRDAVIQEPCEGQVQIGFLLTDEAAAALIEPSVPRVVFEDIWDAGNEWNIEEKTWVKARREDIDTIAAKHGVKVGA